MIEKQTVSDRDANYFDDDNDNENSNNDSNNSDEPSNSKFEVHQDLKPAASDDSSTCQQLLSLTNFQCKQPYQWIQGPHISCMFACRV